MIFGNHTARINRDRLRPKPTARLEDREVGRTAEYSVKGYVYQFLRYLNEILDAGAGTTVTIEGAVEDIDVNEIGSTTAVQCKYHEQADKYTLGKIYKPVLLMVEHFSKMGTTSPDVHYRLFCHFPGSTGTQALA